MRLHLLPSKVDPKAMAVPTKCAYADCTSKQVRLHQPVSKALRDTVHQHLKRGRQMPRRIASDVTLERDVPVPMSDGVQLMANVFRSFPPRRSPVLMSVTPYGKDTLPERRGMLLMRLAGTRFGHLDCSAWTGSKRPIRCSG